jgi:DNA-directed RNA polymerase specialized sigma24 family protein
LEEIATVVGVPLGTVKSRLYRGLNALLARLKGTRP